MFDPRNGPAYSAEFVARYRAAQFARNRQITAWVREQLDWLRTGAPTAPSGARVDNLPFVVHSTAADPRFLDLTLDPSDRSTTTLWGEPWVANYQPATLGHLTSLRAWLSQWSVDDSRANAPAELPNVTVRLHDVAPPTGNPPAEERKGTPRSGARRHGGYPGLTVPSAGSAGAGSCSPMWS